MYICMFEEKKKKKKKKRKKASGKDMLSGVAQVRSLSMFWLFSAPHALNQNGRFDGDCSLCKASTTRKKKALLTFLSCTELLTCWDCLFSYPLF